MWWRREHATIVRKHGSVDGWVSSMLTGSKTACNRWPDSSCGAAYCRAGVTARIAMGGAIVSYTVAAVGVDGGREKCS